MNDTVWKQWIESPLVSPASQNDRFFEKQEKVDSSQGKSATFGVWLPVVDELRTFDGISDEAGTGYW